MDTDDLSKNTQLLIIYPHWHPANLAGVHRPRLTGNYLIELGWKVRVLTVEADCFEETPDPDFYKTFHKGFEVTRVHARNVRKPRIIGDIGLRAYRNLKCKALEILRTEKIDFIWIPIPSFYTALLGPYLYKRTGVPYGIDYIDPWVRDLTNQRNPRAILSQWIARILEPRTVKHAALITGVSENYYLPAIRRSNFQPIDMLSSEAENYFPGKNIYSSQNPEVNEQSKKSTSNQQSANSNLLKPHAAFPYGFDPNDHQIELKNMETPWGAKTRDKQIWLYTGAFLPNSHLFIDSFFQAFNELQTEQKSSSTKPSGNQQPATSNQQPATSTQQLFFLGTGPYHAKQITSYAADHHLSNHVTEIRSRFPYLHTLQFQSAADVVMIIGSTEKHYTASKTYQSLLSKRPIFAILHAESQALQVLEECKADQYTVRYHENMSKTDLVMAIKPKLQDIFENRDWNPDLSALEKYSSLESAKKLDHAVRKVLNH